MRFCALGNLYVICTIFSLGIAIPALLKSEIPIKLMVIILAGFIATLITGWGR